MKKFISAIIIVLIALIGIMTLGACNTNAQTGYTLVVPDGAPALAIAQLPSNITVGGESRQITKKVVSSAVINQEAAKSDVDIAIVPANIAAKMFNSGVDYRLLATVTNGNLYMTSSIPCGQISLEDLKGKLVFSIGQSGVPDTIFKTALTDANVPYTVSESAIEGKVAIKYCADGSEVISKLSYAKSKGELVFGLYAEPAVTNSKAKGFEEVLDLQAIWGKDGGEKGYAQAVLIARKSICEDNQFVDALIKAFMENQQSILQDPAKAINNIKEIYPQSSLPNTMTSQVIERCNIKTIVADVDGRAYYERTLEAVLAVNANSIGGKLPSDDFYIWK